MQADNFVDLRVAVVALAVLCSGCVTSSIEQIRHTPQAVQVSDTESVVILSRRQHNNRETENSFLECVTENLSGDDINLIPEQAFKDRMFPWFEPRVAPLTTESLPRLIARKEVSDRLRQTGVRYIVWLDGTTDDGDRGGSMSCVAGPGGGGCLGFMWWEKNAGYDVAIWDMDKIESVGKISLNARGTSFMPAVIIPIPLIARTQTAACDGVSSQVREFLQRSK